MECLAVVLTLLSSSCNSFGCLPATWNCHKVTISQCVPSAKGSLVILIPVSSKFPFVPASPDLVSQSFCYFTTICKLEPLAFTWNVRLVPIWKCQSGTSADVIILVREQRLGNLVLTLTAPWATCGHHGGSNITCSPLRTKNQFGEQCGAWDCNYPNCVSPGLETGECIGRPISLVSTDTWQDQAIISSHLTLNMLSELSTLKICTLVRSKKPEKWRKRALDKFVPDRCIYRQTFALLELLTELMMVSV